ncbi:MAG: Glyoxylate reductase [Planctomycetota bacterium]|nr:Glyoxylate reductase [Planctomycetota bacterium]
MRPFRIALTGDFLDDRGQSAYGSLGLPLLDARPDVAYRFLRDQAPQAGDPSYWRRFYSMQLKPEHVENSDGLIVLRPSVNRATFARGAADLVVIGRSGAGYDKIDVDACTENDVALFNAPDALTHPTASSALLFMLALAKKMRGQETITREGRWDRQAEVMGHEVAGRTLGIIGLGHSGLELVRLVAPFGMTVIAYSPSADPAVAAGRGVRLTSLDEVMRTSDFVSVHARLTPEKHRMIRAEHLAMMKPTAYFINIARGELVDQDALTARLRDRKIAGAGLDVFEVEPLPRDHPLIGLDNVILTPHWSCSTADVWNDTGLAMAEGMLRVARGELPGNLINPEVADRSGFREKLARFAENRS